MSFFLYIVGKFRRRITAIFDAIFPHIMYNVNDKSLDGHQILLTRYLYIHFTFRKCIVVLVNEEKTRAFTSGACIKVYCAMCIQVPGTILTLDMAIGMHARFEPNTPPTCGL